MRYMMMHKADADSEAGVPPTKELIENMGALMQQMGDAGVLVAGEGLHGSSSGKRLNFSGGDLAVTDGPFAETKELIAGFVILDVDSLDDAVEWAKLFAAIVGDVEIDIRRVVMAEDFGDEFTPEAREREDKLREQIGQK
jgi:hypothetical protein